MKIRRVDSFSRCKTRPHSPHVHKRGARVSGAVSWSDRLDASRSSITRAPLREPFVSSVTMTVGFVCSDEPLEARYKDSPLLARGKTDSIPPSAPASAGTVARSPSDRNGWSPSVESVVAFASESLAAFARKTQRACDRLRPDDPERPCGGDPRLRRLARATYEE